jgi:dihydroneopterin aldolase
MTIHIEDLKFQCIIGILDFERTSPQDVIINMAINYKYKDRFLNYAEVVDMLKQNMVESQFFLLEDAMESIAAKLLKKYGSIKTIDIKITKPSIMPDCMVSVSNRYKS